MDLKKLFIEMTVVGFALVVISLTIGYLSDVIQQRTVVFFPDHFWGMVNGTFLSGALFHLICEVTGLNQWYVNQYKRLL